MKCPSISYHLAGAKKIQQELAKTGVLERYLPIFFRIMGLSSCEIQIESFFFRMFWNTPLPLMFLNDFLGSNPSYRCNADIGLGWETLVLYH